MAPNHDWKDIILFSISFMFGSLLISGLEVIKKFIQSKPPGRRLVGIEIFRILHIALPPPGDSRHPCLPGGLPPGALWHLLPHTHGQSCL